MDIKRGKIKDIARIMDIIKAAIANMEAEKVYQWDDMYPNEMVIKDDIINENLYVYIDENIIKGIIVLNETQDGEYKKLKWKYSAKKQIVIHRLCIDPQYQGKGIAKKFLKYAEEYSMENNYGSIRLDAFTKNKTAYTMYEKLGYEKVGIVTFRKGDFYCFEKNLN